MKKLFLSAVTALFILGTTYAFAGDIQKTDSIKTKSEKEIQIVNKRVKSLISTFLPD